MNLPRTVYQVNAKRVCELIEENEKRAIHRSFCQYLYSAWMDPEKNTCGHRRQLVLTNRPELVAVAIDWDRNECTAKNIEDLVSIITPQIRLNQLFDQILLVPSSSITPLDLIGLICFYGGTMEVVFSYDPHQKRWMFSFDGHNSVLKDWQSVLGKCLDCHLQPFLLIYVNNRHDPLHIDHIFPGRTSNSIYDVPTTDDYINTQMVMKVMQQQLLKKDQEKKKIQEIDESSSVSSQRDSGLDSCIHDGSSDESQHEHDPHSSYHKSLMAIEQYFEESTLPSPSAIESCQSALRLIDQILDDLSTRKNNTGLAIYLRRKKNTFLSRLHILQSSPKKTVSFSDQIALIVPTADDHPPTEHLIHSFLRQIQEEEDEQVLSSSESDEEIPVGLTECTLCHKRSAMDQQMEQFCRNCHFYMQRFQSKK